VCANGTTLAEPGRAMLRGEGVGINQEGMPAFGAVPHTHVRQRVVPVDAPAPGVAGSAS
jgi:hypothetical protein